MFVAPWFEILFRVSLERFPCRFFSNQRVEAESANLLGFQYMQRTEQEFGWPTAGFFISEVIVRLSVAIAKRSFGGTLELFAVMLA